MEKVFSRHVATGRMLSGAYKSEYGADQEIQTCIDRVEVCIWNESWGMISGKYLDTYGVLNS